MRELSLNVLDVVQNSISAKASLIAVTVEENTAEGTLRIAIEDNGGGMSPEQLERVQSPFYTTRTTRPVGLGVPFFKMASEMTGGEFSIRSQPGKGTVVSAGFRTGHIDMTPLGNMNETMLLLITCNPDINFVYRRARDERDCGEGERSFTLDTRELREILGEDVALNAPDVVAWIRDFLDERQAAL